MMFEDHFEDLIKKVFKIKKVTFDIPSESAEQECIFIQIDQARPSIRDGEELYHVSGLLRIFVNKYKLPFGYILKCIREADPEDTKDLFLFNFENNGLRFRNIVERSCGFEYFYKGQYDPSLGVINSIEIGVN